VAPTGNRQDARTRAERAHQLRAIGRTWAEISSALGYKSRGAAQLAVQRLLERTPPVGAEALRRQEAEELRIRRSVLHERFHDARQRNDDDALVALNRELDRVASRWSKLHGLDAPERQEVNVHVNQTPAAIIAEARERLLAVVDAEVVELPNHPNRELTA
jgi:hypothetical protein